jgi:cysteine desulfurase
MDIVYFDNSSTTKPHREVIDEVAMCMDNYFGNPSSAHRLGAMAEKKIKEAKDKVAGLIKANGEDIIFTSGGSEANNTAILGIVSKGDHVITSKIEHPSVLKVMEKLESQGIEITYLDVNRNGIIDLNTLESSIKGNTRLVSIMHVNNEIGSIQPISKIIEVVRARSRRAKVHIDAIQSVGKLGIDVKRLDLDMLSLSAHKIHGPKGVGALYIKKGLVIKPFIEGGGQERGLRSGTENLPGASGFGVAAQVILSNMNEKVNNVNKIKESFIEKLKEIEGVFINSPLDDIHIGNILSVSFEGVRGEVLLHALEDYKIYVSTGSACSSKKSSHNNYVLPFLGIKEALAEGTIRFSFSYLNNLTEVDYTIDALKKILPFLRRGKK